MEHLERAREFYMKLRGTEGGWQYKRALLGVMGYPLAETEREVELIERTLYKALYPPRSGGMV